MSDPLGALIEFVADDLGVLARDVRRAFERAEARDLASFRVIDRAPASDSEEMEAVRQAGRGKCLCPLATIERVLIDHGQCSRAGCPYGGDI